MATTDTPVQQLIINKLTKAQYNTITPSNTELYFITDEAGISSSDVITALGYTPENHANLVTTLTSASTDTTYPSAKAVYDALQVSTSAIAANTSNIASNTTAIAANTSNIASNTSAIASNTSAIATNTTAIASNTSAIATNTTAIAANTSNIATNTTAIAGITTLIPSAATSSNQLADKNFVNSSVATNTANFIGTFNSVAELEAYSGTLTNNDYAFVIGTDSDGNTVYNRYKYVASTTTWTFEYALNNSSFTAAQWAAINSGITASNKVTRSGTVAVGSTIKPVYVDANGVVQEAAYSLAKSVPADAVFTDTTYATTDTVSSGSSSLITSGGVYSAISGKQDSSTAVTHTASTAVGNTITPVYISSTGSATALNYTIAKSVPADAVFTDTTYSVMTGASSVAAGATGLVPQPAAGDNEKFLRGDGTWATVAAGSTYAMQVIDYTS